MYYIYHIPGIKIGCTKTPKRRVEQQGYTEFTILETHTDIQIASERERQLQKEYGYKVDSCDYSKSIQGYSLEKVINAGRASAEKQWKENREIQIDRSKKGGKINSEKTGKKTYMCDKDGNLIMTFKNRKDAARYINGFAAPLKNVINHPTRTYKGYVWKD
jgi:Trm5-related predicted tRNA methylase